MTFSEEVLYDALVILNDYVKGAFHAPSLPPVSALQVTLAPATEPGREVIRILVIDSTHGVERIIHELYRLGFAEVREWSKPQPTGRTHEIMRVLTRYVMAE